MAKLGIYVDESGEQEGASKYYLLTLVFLDDSDNINSQIDSYEGSLRAKGLPRIPFHASPLMNGNDDYAHLELQTRKRLLNAFNVFVQNLPVKYATFAYKRKWFAGVDVLGEALRKDVASFLMGNLEKLQKFSDVIVHYDGGQEVVTNALKRAMGDIFSSGVVSFCKDSFRQNVLLQAADYFCALELARIKYENHEETSTDLKIYGYVGTFKNNYLKQAKRKRLLVSSL